MRYLILPVFFIIYTGFQDCTAQGTILPCGDESYWTLERLRIKSGAAAGYHPALKPYLRGDVVAFAARVDSSGIALSAKDKKDIQYLYDDNHEWLITSEEPTTLMGKQEPMYKKVYVDSTKTFYRLEEITSPEEFTGDRRYSVNSRPILKTFYKTPASFFEIHKKDFHFTLNPLLNFKFAKDLDHPELIFFNQRGGEFRGSVDDRIYFYSSILESQVRLPQYVNDYSEKYSALPGAGLYKPYKSVIFNINQGYDYLLAQGYIGFNVTRHVGFQLGHGRHFIGNGYRSMLLSDFSTNYLYLKINTRIWKFHYQNIFAELVAEPRSGPGDRIIGKKYMAAHLLSYNFNDRLNVSFFETVVLSRTNQFELQYLNPVILYRTVEHALGSPDNVLIGFDGRWDFAKRFSAYGQVILDEFKFSILVNDFTWWGNKFGAQAGLKYIDVLGIDHLDAQVEWNMARPYTYTYGDSLTNYSHYRQPLAHPLGANFQEMIYVLRYNPVQRLLLEGRLIKYISGDDPDDVTNYGGGNILLNYTTRVSDYGNRVAQGVRANTQLLALDVSYAISHNFYADLHFQMREKKSKEPEFSQKSTFFGGGLRLNLSRQKHDF